MRANLKLVNIDSRLALKISEGVFSEHKDERDAIRRVNKELLAESLLISGFRKVESNNNEDTAQRMIDKLYKSPATFDIDNVRAEKNEKEDAKILASRVFALLMFAWYDDEARDYAYMESNQWGQWLKKLGLVNRKEFGIDQYKLRKVTSKRPGFYPPTKEIAPVIPEDVWRVYRRFYYGGWRALWEKQYIDAPPSKEDVR
jgi:hypothetical protein